MVVDDREVVLPMTTTMEVKMAAVMTDMEVVVSRIVIPMAEDASKNRTEEAAKKVVEDMAGRTHMEVAANKIHTEEDVRKTRMVVDVKKVVAATLGNAARNRTMVEVVRKEDSATNPTTSALKDPTRKDRTREDVTDSHLGLPTVVEVTHPTTSPEQSRRPNHTLAHQEIQGCSLPYLGCFPDSTSRSRMKTSMRMMLSNSTRASTVEVEVDMPLPETWAVQQPCKL